MWRHSHAVDALNSSDRVREIVRNHKLVERLPVASKQIGSGNGALHHAEEAICCQNRWPHIPVACNNARAAKASDSSCYYFAKNLVLLVHSNGVSEIQCYEEASAFCNRRGPNDRDAMREGLGYDTTVLRGYARPFSG